MPDSGHPAASPKTKHKTCKRYNEPGHAHALTFACFANRPFLSRDRTRGWMLDAIAHARDRHRFDLWAYVIMPEHVHRLIYPTQLDYSISRILSSLKQPVSKRAIVYVRKHAPDFLARMTDTQPNGKTSLRFWHRGGGYDRNLWSPSYIWETIEYIHSNPVRRGLCDSETDWPWSSAGVFSAISDGPLGLDLESLPDDPRGR